MACELIAMCFASMDIRGKDPCFLLANVASAPIAELAGGTLSLSCGVSRYDFCTPVPEADSSDRAMYEAKTAGKNRCVVA